MTPQEALNYSLDLFGNVDMEQLCTLTDMSKSELVNALQEEIYLNPMPLAYETRDEWLTGNVADKLEAATDATDNLKDGELAEAQRAVNALQAAQPMGVTFEDIELRFGARWVPVKFYERFLKDMNAGYFGKCQLYYSEATEDYLGDVYVSRQEWVACGHTASETVMWALRGVAPNFYYKDGGKRVEDKEKHMRAVRVIEDINEAWHTWLNAKKQADVRKELTAIYNRLFCSEVRPQYDGSHQTFPGLRLDNFGYSDLYPSQKDAIWMIKQNNGGICWHQVGTGKTLIMCVAAHEMKRIGKVRKPIIIGLKANIAQIAETYRKAFPEAKMYFPTAKEWTKKERENTIARICNEDWDVIIMTHDQFENLPAANKARLQEKEQELDKLTADVKECRARKWVHEKTDIYGITSLAGNRQAVALVKRLAKAEEEYLDLRAKVAAQPLDFADTGIDHIFVDESHMFKNLPFATRNMRVGGVGNPQGSGRAERMLYAIRDIQRRSGHDMGATFASGTVVTNSLTELFIVLTYLRPRAMRAQHMETFDGWSMQYCIKETDYEINVVGQLCEKERFASFVNLPELSKFLSQITDYRTSVMCGIDAPKEVQHFESAKPTPNQEEMLKKLLAFVNSGGKWSELGIQRERPANLDKALMLVATNVARQTALDPRILDDCQTYGDENGCKVRRCAENIVRLYREFDEHKGTQFVFNDISTLDKSKWNMQQELRDLLVDEYGIPECEVQFVSEATTDTKRLELFDKMNRGEVRVLIGSTQKLGTGVNAQERAVAIHHLDIPWRPSDLEQRNGRALRKGNTVKEWGNNEVQVFIYATERTLDAYKFNLLKSKQMFIEQLNNGTLGIRRIDDDVIGGEDDKSVSYAEFLSILSGNTDLLEKAKLDAKILAMTKDRAAFYRERSNAAHKVEEYDENISTLSKWIAFAEHDIKCAADVTQDTLPVITLQGYQPQPDEANDPKAVGRQIGEMIDKFIPKDYTIIGTCGSLRMACYRNAPQGDQNVGDIFFYIVGDSGQYYKYTMNNGRPYRNNYEAAAAYAFVTLQQLPKQIEWNKREIDRMNAELPQLREFAAKEWGGAEKLQELKVKLDAVKLRINPPKEEKAA